MKKKKELFEVVSKKKTEKDWLNKKRIAKILFFVILLGSIILVSINFYVITSVYSIKIKEGEFERISPTNETIILRGYIEIDNRHWNSVDIEDLKVRMKIDIDDIEILDKRIIKDNIPRGKKSKIEVKVDFTYEEFIKFQALTTSDEIEIEAIISFSYFLYKVYFEISFDSEI